MNWRVELYQVPFVYIFEVNLTFDMLTVRGQQHSFSTHERVFLWKCQSFWDRKCLDLRGTRTPNLPLLINMTPQKFRKIFCSQTQWFSLNSIGKGFRSVFTLKQSYSWFISVFMIPENVVVSKSRENIHRCDVQITFELYSYIRSLHVLQPKYNYIY